MEHMIINRNFIMKYIYLIVLVLISSTAFAKLQVFACEPEWGALVKEIAGNKVKVFNATTGLQDPHYIQARPSLIAKARKADLLICTGAELEVGWLPVILRKANNNKIKSGSSGYIMATEHVYLLEKPTHLDRSEGDIHSQGNPHIQVNPYYIAEVAEVVLQRLIAIDGENKVFYQDNYQKFNQNWQQAITKWEEKAKRIQGKAIVVHHNSWVYLADWLDMNIVATLEPKPGIPPTAQHLSKTVQILQDNPVYVIIYSSYQNPKAAQWLSQKTEVPALLLPSTVGGTKDAKDLFSLFDVIINTLTNAAH